MSKRIGIQRIYDDARNTSGRRVLVDRVWPRGISKDEAELDGWYKDIAPSTGLRQWFGHDPKRWAEFKQKYREELKADEKRRRLEELARIARSDGLLLLYGAKDPKHNQAVVLREVVQEMLDSSS